MTPAGPQGGQVGRHRGPARFPALRRCARRAMAPATRVPRRRRRTSPAARESARAVARRRCADARTSMCRTARWGSATTSSSVATGPATRPAAFSASQASRLDLVAAHDSMAGRMSDSRWSSQPCGVANRGSSAHSGRPIARARSGHWCGAQDLQHEPPVGGPRTRAGCPATACPSGMPIDQKLGTTSSTATMASSMATSTCWARPGPVALAQRGQGPDDGEQRRDDVAEPAHRRADRRLTLGCA